MDPMIGGYGLLEHFLFWRLEVLYNCRRYAVEYLRHMAEVFYPANMKHVEAARVSYEMLIELFDGNLHIVYGSEAEKWGTNMLWRGGGGEHPIRELFSTAEGRRRFADLLLEMRNLESKANSKIEDLVRVETS